MLEVDITILLDSIKLHFVSLLMQKSSGSTIRQEINCAASARSRSFCYAIPSCVWFNDKSSKLNHADNLTDSWCNEHRELASIVRHYFDANRKHLRYWLCGCCLCCGWRLVNYCSSRFRLTLPMLGANFAQRTTNIFVNYLNLVMLVFIG